MIREYLYGDIDKIEANEYTLMDSIKQFIDNENIHKYVIDRDGIRGIICFYEYHPECLEGFFIISDKIEFKDIKQLKLLLEKLIIQFNPIRMQTTSEDCPTINKWMEFLGFECEGIRRKYMYGKDFKMWSRLHGI